MGIIINVVAPSEAFGNNSRPLLALRDALRRGEITRVLKGPVRAHVAGARSLRQMTPALLELVISGYRSGLSVYALAERHGIHRQTVTNHLVEAGVTLRRTITQAERQRARELYVSGAYIKDIAKMLGRSPATIAKLVRPLVPVANEPTRISTGAVKECHGSIANGGGSNRQLLDDAGPET